MEFMEGCNEQGNSVANYLGCDLVVIGGGSKNENSKIRV